MKSRLATSLRWILPCASRGQLSHFVAGGFALVTWLFGLVSVFGLLSWCGLGALDFGAIPRGIESEWEWTSLGPRLCGLLAEWPPLWAPPPCPPPPPLALASEGTRSSAITASKMRQLRMGPSTGGPGTARRDRDGTLSET